MKILALDTATEGCSAALWIDGALLERAAELPRGHADRILKMVQELLAESGTALRALDAIAFGRGPGSFTGVRLAASVTQGLAFGADLGVVPVSDLRAVAQGSLAAQAAQAAQPAEGSQGSQASEGSRTARGSLTDQGLRTDQGSRTAGGHADVLPTLVCNDARMQEVYWSCFVPGPGGLMQPVGAERVSKPAAVMLPDAWRGPVFGAGRGFASYPQLRAALGAVLAGCDEHILPWARDIAALAVPEVRAGRLVPAEQALPTYLRDDVAQPKSRN
ncbi:MAG TPA: tRNA (adenosine(37)-N6)-threonylcarbamoyltransferase complex dimerization subunit type 1 TsaB [Steroidobacteraceae bacterium]|nr:tRNA (adenosine(37)-N6)-threonylcarbamoyltransferase complex dimerization subunit type 1 TsaB [Steroidobacteraceae bacterium]